MCGVQAKLTRFATGVSQGDSVDEFYRRAGPLSRREVQGRIECNKQVKEAEIPEHGYKLR